MNSEAAKDYLFLGFIISLSFVLYIGGLGFYSDDWAFLGASYRSTDRSLMGLYESLNGPVVWMRPVQVFYFAALYKLFDLGPFGWHLVNHVIFLAGILFFYAVLKELNQPRLVSLTIPLVFGLMPHYSTDRFWPILFCANLSMTSFFLSFYCDLRMLRASGARVWSWKLLGIIFLLAGTLAYEVFLPLFLLSALMIWRKNQQLNKTNAGIAKNKLALLFATNFIALIFVVLFKALTTTRVIMQGPMDHVVWFMKMILDGAMISYGKYAIELPFVISNIVRKYPDWKIIAMSLFVCLSVFLFLHRVAKGSALSELRGYRMSRLIAFGILVFVLGYLIFITNENADPTPAGLNNRTAIAATVGVAITLIGGIGWVVSKFHSEQFRSLLFCSFVALFCGTGVLITNTIAHFWIVAYSEQEKILSDIRRQYPSLPSNSTLLLDGVCPYVGPGIVFEADWDVAGALRLFYKDYSLKGDVIRPTVRVTDKGVETILYGGVTNYPYNKLYIYHYGRKVSQQLQNAEDARNYFQKHNPHYGLECPESKEGVGVAIF